MRLVSVDTATNHQAFITGRVSDFLTKKLPYTPFEIEVRHATPANQPVRPYPLDVCTVGTGLFAVFGDPRSALPDGTSGNELLLRLAVSAEGYQPFQVDVTLAADELTRANRTIDAEGLASTAVFIDAPVRRVEIELVPKPVSLAGRVVRADEPDVGLAGAQVSFSSPHVQPAVPTNAQGFFVLPNLPVADAVELNVQHADFPDPLVKQYRPDYRQPVNRVTLPMV